MSDKISREIRKQVRGLIGSTAHEIDELINIIIGLSFGKCLRFCLGILFKNIEWATFF